MKRVVIPIDLGGSATPCALRPPRRKADLAETVEALVERYQEDRVGDSWEVGFFHGGLPTKLQLEACRDLPARLACSPADLNRKSANFLFEGGVRIIELEALTFQPRVLKGLQRGYSAGRVWRMIDELHAMGFELGITLSPGLPGFRFEDCISDAEQLASKVADKVSFVRLYPALAFDGSIASTWLATGRWVPIEVDEAVTICRQMVELLTAAGLAVARIGLQPGQDLSARVLGGPNHPNLRALVQSARFKDRLAVALSEVPTGEAVELRVNPKDLSWVKGVNNENIREARSSRSLLSLEVVCDGGVPRGEFHVTLCRQDGETG